MTASYRYRPQGLGSIFQAAPSLNSGCPWVATLQALDEPVGAWWLARAGKRSIAELRSN